MADQAPEHDKRLFSYAEACALLPEVRRITEEAHERVLTLQSGDASGLAEAQEAANEVIRNWTQALMERGVEVKGLWLADFDNGSGYYCWQYPEASLQYYHTYEDGFRGRVRIQ